MTTETKKIGNIRISGARLLFRNFQGKPSDYNAAGNRTFCVVLDDDLARDLEDDGWNVKYQKPREDDPSGYRRPYLSVKVKFGKIPPNIVLINSRGKKKLTEETVNQLDWSWIEYVDVVIRPYNYPAMPGKPAGIAAYLKSLYVTVKEDEFEEKYADIPDLDARDVEPYYEDEV